MVDKEEIVRQLETVRAKLNQADIAKHFKKWSKTMQYHFTDTDEYWTIKVVDGKPEPLAQGKVESAEVQYEMTSDTFLKIFRKEITAMTAYTQKLVKTKASIPDLMKVKKLSD